MNISQFLQERTCPVCHSNENNHILFQENFDEKKLNNLAFSSRKTPEFMNLRLVCCPSCDLLYASSIPSSGFLSSAYHETGYESNDEAQFAAKSYAKYLSTIVKSLPDQEVALEVGAGNGSFLQYLLEAGFKKVVGIEPSVEAISAASPQIKNYIRTGMFNVNDYPKHHFSLIAIFQTLEHIDNPQKFFNDAFQLLKSGGVLMLVAHNYRYWLMRLLGKKSPIIDISHLQLFSPKSLRYALNNVGFQKIQIHSLKNIYPLHYWIKLLPMPSLFKHKFLPFLKNGMGKRIADIPLGMKVGNMMAWCYRD